jgi:hypothetical protein
VKIVNANWRPELDAPDGRFEIIVVTDDDEQYVLPSAQHR